MSDAEAGATYTSAEERWRALLMGRDPFDALRGRRIPRAVCRSARARQIVIQLRKRIPVDLGGLLGVEPFVMAKSAGAFLTARSRASFDEGVREDLAALRAVALGADGCLGGGRWGYEFDVQTRWAYYPSGSPNLIATFFVARGLGEAGCALREEEWLSMLHQSADYLAAELYVADGPEPHFRYVPDSGTLVHNANVLGAGLVAASAALRGDPTLAARALDAALTTVGAQDADGGWPYGEAPRLSWQDNFHTAYVLDGLLLVWLATAEPRVESALRRGAANWEQTFFGRAGEPYYGPGAAYPLDIHSAGTAMDVGARLATWGLMGPAIAETVGAWTEANLVDPVTGAAWYRKNRLSVDRRRFPRWNDAHLALGRSSLALLRSERLSPLELRVNAAQVASSGAGARR